MIELAALMLETRCESQSNIRYRRRSFVQENNTHDAGVASQERLGRATLAA